MHAPQREMYTACEEFQQRLATNPKANTHGLKANCTETGNGGISVELVDHARAVSVEQARAIVHQVAEARIDGIWEFTINTIEK
jgi:hypothetical protein